MAERIVVDPSVMAGRACIVGTRITVALLVNLVANGMTTEVILDEYPSLAREDLQAALLYAAMLANDEVHPLLQDAG